MAAVESANADVVVVVAYGRFIPSEILSATQLGAVNIHPSLLPRHRGPSPVATAILDGDAFTGVSLMLLDQGMDTGPILLQSAPVEITQETRVDGLTDHLFEVGAGMLPAVLNDLASGVLSTQPQDDAGATVTRLIRKEDGVVDWDAPAERIVRMNRAFHPWPGTSTVWDGELLKLIDVELASGERIPSGIDPGVVLQREGQGVCVSAGDGYVVRLVEVQAAGKRAMSAVSLLSGGLISLVLDWARVGFRDRSQILEGERNDYRLPCTCLGVASHCAGWPNGTELDGGHGGGWTYGVVSGGYGCEWR